MPDAEVEILIKAIDEFSKTLKNIETAVTKSQEIVQKQSTQTTQTFDNQLNSLVALGNAASSVDNIFDSYQNLQGRVENATERLNNAQDRLTKAQKNLSRVQRDTASSTEDIEDAQQELVVATRSLTIAQNNLERTNNMIIGTYINMGVQVLNLLNSLPRLISSLGSLTTASMAFVATPLGVTLVGATAALGLFINETKRANQVLEENQKLVQNVHNALTTLSTFDPNQAKIKALEELKETLQKTSAEEIRLAKKGDEEALHRLEKSRIARIRDIDLQLSLLQDSAQETQKLLEMPYNEWLTYLETEVASRASAINKKIIDDAYSAIYENQRLLHESNLAQSQRKSGSLLGSFLPTPKVTSVNGSRNSNVTVNIGNIFGNGSSPISRALGKELNNVLSR